MIKIIKKTILSALSILAFSTFIWIVFLLNPSLSYAHQTPLDNITIYHNQPLEEGTEILLKNTIEIIKASDIYDEHLKIDLCLNDDKIYPHLYPFAGATAYAFLDKTVIYASTPNFNENYTGFSWAINNYESRKYDLTRLLAHEFMHNLQANFDPYYYIKSTLGQINWKFEGHAEYIARSFKNDGQLKIKIALYQIEEQKAHKGVPVIHLQDGTIQNLSYYKCALVLQYLMEEKNLNFKEICALESGIDMLYVEMINWCSR